MGIRFIYGRAGSGKSSFCIDEISKKINDNSIDKLIYIVPEQYTFQRETLLLRKVGEKALLKAEVLSFKRMAHRIFEAYGGRVHDRMKDSGRSMLIHKILQNNEENMSYFNRISKEHGFTDIISETITEFKKYNVFPENIDGTIDNIEDKELKEKLMDLSLIYSKFNESIAENMIDGDDELTLLAEKLKLKAPYKNTEIWIDEFTTFTPQQMEVIRALAGQCKTINITLCMDELGDGKGDEVTDIFNVIKGTEYRILSMMRENNIGYENPVDLNKDIPYRFRESKELAHLEKYFFTYPFKLYKEPIKDLRLYKANNSYDEIEEVSREIIRLVRDENYRYRDISVVCRNIDEYEKITTVIFNEYGIPFFLDKKIDILNNPLIILILSTLEIYIRNWSYETIFKYLKSGLAGISRDEIDKLENYVLSKGIKGYKWTGELPAEAEEEIVDIMDRVRTPLMNFHKSIINKDVRAVCTAIYNFLVEIDVFNRIDEWIKEFEDKGLQSKVKEYEQVSEIVLDILNQAVEVMGFDKIDIDEFYKILISGFESKEIGVIPAALDQVNVGDIARIKGREVKALFIVGVKEVKH